MKKIVLFGAGASYGTSHVLPTPPPLGSQLFGKLVASFPDLWGKLPAEYAKEFKSDFEKGMLRIMESGSHLVGPLMQSMALLFTSFRPDGSKHDLYSLLLTKLRSTNSISKILFTTLNYECILEVAACGIGLLIHYNFDFLPPPVDNIAIWKLHGSCNFLPDPKELSILRVGSFHPATIFNVKLIQVGPDQAAQWLQGNTALYPAMCMFTLNKPSQISPGVFAEYRRRWAQLVESAEDVVVIGARPHAPDKHIWEPLEATTASLHFVGSDSEFKRWAPSRGDRKTSFLGKTFSGTMKMIGDILR